MITTHRLKKYNRGWGYAAKRTQPLYWINREALTDKQVDRFCNLTLQWCEGTFGTKGTRSIPEIEWAWKDAWYQKNNFLAFYDWEDNTMHLRVQGHRTWNNLCASIIHEYIHYIQGNPKRYEREMLEMGYGEHPYEIEAEGLARQYAVECCNWVTKRMRIK